MQNSNISWKRGIVVEKDKNALLVKNLLTKKSSLCLLSELEQEGISNLIDLFPYLRKKVRGKKDTPMIIDEDALLCFEQLYQ